MSAYGTLCNRSEGISCSAELGVENAVKSLGSAFVAGAAIALYCALLITAYDFDSQFQFKTEVLIGIPALLVAAATAWSSIQSSIAAEAQVRAARQQAQAAMLAERLKVYQATKEFLHYWLRDGLPDLTKLHLLVGAWEAAHFLFSDKTVKFLRELWLDAVQCDFHYQVVMGSVEGESATASQRVMDLTVK